MEIRDTRYVGTPDGLDIAYQSDSNSTGTPYSVWLDKVKLTFW